MNRFWSLLKQHGLDAAVALTLVLTLITGVARFSRLQTTVEIIKNRADKVPHIEAAVAANKQQASKVPGLDASVTMLTNEASGFRSARDALLSEIEAKLEELRAYSPGVKVGTIVPYAGAITHHGKEMPGGEPDGWLLCDGREVPREGQYQTLRELLRHSGLTNKEKQVFLPDLRGRFPRGLDDPDGQEGSWPPRGLDNGGRYREIDRKRVELADGNVVCSYQDDLTSSHGLEVDPQGGKHHHSINQSLTAQDLGDEQRFTTGGGNFYQLPNEELIVSDAKSAHNHTLTGGEETRPTNVAVNWIIRY